MLRILLLMRNFLPAWKLIQEKTWDVPRTAAKSWDLKGKTVGTVGGGRIGYDTLRRLEVRLNFSIAGQLSDLMQLQEIRSSLNLKGHPDG